ncbi:ligase-associated DNA damage response exonuclease [Ancylobacter terrae]|uniref:ligase-associated DNA damage response exonuclease n=1 Tax=Ancylobacter sp. sgz301288 TaxID=3342077 RepID=UPI00385FF9D6
MRPEDLLQPRPEGLYSPAGDFHIDPMRPVRRALVTHGHSDHARAGHGAVLATRQTLDIMAIRYGADFAGATQAARYGERIEVGGVGVSFHPAGHILGSAQIAVEKGGCRIVASGDYKPGPDPTSAPFEPVACDVFISEATFGLPVYRHPDPLAEIGRLLQSLALFPERAHLVGAYALGKAQRVMALARAAGHDAPIFLHGAMERLTDYYVSEGIALGELRPVRGAAPAELAGAIVICPPSAMGDVWSRRFPDPVAAFASGWMRIRARARQRGVELPLVISDHADWEGLQASIRATGCSELWVTHGEADALVHWALREGLAARPLHLVGYGEEEAEAGGTGAEAGTGEAADAAAAGTGEAAVPEPGDADGPSASRKPSP